MRRATPDTVALVLALSLGLSLFMLALASVINVWTKQNPYPTLGENTTQIMTTVMGGIIGVLGSYIGARMNQTKAALREAQRNPDPAAATEVLASPWPGEEKR
jgi:hypothetical protein